MKKTTKAPAPKTGIKKAKAPERMPRLVHDVRETPHSAFQRYHKMLLERTRAPISPAQLPLLDKCLRITGSFEGSGYNACSGNFDNQGGSLGILQWCWGQGSLQPLLKEYMAGPNAAFNQANMEKITELQRGLTLSTKAQVAWVTNLLGTRESPKGPWADFFRALAVTPEFVAIQQRAAGTVFGAAIQSCDSWGLKTERGVSFAFDTHTQQGGFGKSNERIKSMVADFKSSLHPSRALTEREMMEQMTRGRTMDSIPRWQADVLSRRYAIIRGRTAPFNWKGEGFSGRVHGESLDIDGKFGLTDNPWPR